MFRFSIRLTTLAGAALLAGLATQPQAAAQTATSATASQAGDIDLEDAPAARRALQDEARHVDRVARLKRLRELAANNPERLAQIDDLERRERTGHEARRLRNRGQLSERSARGVDDLARRGGTYRARGQDVSIARERRREVVSDADAAARRGGTQAERRGATPERSPPRATRPTPSSTPRPPSRSPSRGTSSTSSSNRGGRSPR
jgi:hypothetical protein